MQKFWYNWRHNREAMKYRTLLPALFLALAAFPCFAQSLAPQCASLTSMSGLPNPTTVINASTLNAARAAQGNTPALPEHCEVQGRMNERTGVNAQRYAIRFHLRLPTAWNGRFFFEGGGGSNGNLGDALGNIQGQQPTNALVLGYAVVSQDSGHDNPVNSNPKLNGSVPFGFDEQARLDFGYNSYDQVTQAAKALIKVYYGKPPDRSYYVGCSEGGREAMMMSQRFPEYYDGILACSPGFKLPKAAIGEAWDTQAFAEVAKASGVNDPNGEPFINKTFTDADMTLVANTILAACDKLDGLEDGIISNFPACKPKLTGLTCKGAKEAGCLSASQISALEKVYAGAKNSKGEALYADWAWDAGIGNPGWRVWKLGMFAAPTNSSINAPLGSGAISAVFTTPPTPAASTGASPV